MNVRAINPSDIGKLKKIHEKFFAQEFEFPDFLSGYLCAFIVEANGELIAAGGVRQIAESVLVTNKDIEIEKRRHALLKILDVSEFVCKKFNHDQLHAFIQDEKWERHLESIGFRPTKGKSLVIDL